LDLALLEVERQRFEQAWEMVEAVFEMTGEMSPPDWARVSDLCGRIAEAKRAAGEASEARRILAEAVRAAERGFGADHPLVGDCLVEMGTLLHSTGDPAAAVTRFERALEIHRLARGTDSTEVLRDYERLAEAHHSLGDFEKAAECYKRALYMRERQVGGDGSEMTTLMVNLAQIYSSWGRYSPAMELYQQAAGRLGSSRDGRLARTLESLGALYERCGRNRDAAGCYSRAHGIWEQAPGDHGPELERVSALLAVIAPELPPEEPPPDRVARLGAVESPGPPGHWPGAPAAAGFAPPRRPEEPPPDSVVQLRAVELPVPPGYWPGVPAAAGFAPPRRPEEPPPDSVVQLRAVELPVPPGYWPGVPAAAGSAPGMGAVAAGSGPLAPIIVVAAPRLHGWDELAFDLLPEP
jgi:tetratricopeptide (TPR) repeat protein